MTGTVLTRERPEGTLFHCWRHLRWFTVKKIRGYCEPSGCVRMFEETGHFSKRGRIEGQRVQMRVKAGGC